MVKFLRLYFRLWRHHQIPVRAAALTYTSILGLIPMLAVCLSAFSLVVGVQQLSTGFKGFLMKYLVPSAGNQVATLIDNFLAKVQFKAIGYVGFAAVLLTALLMLSSIEDSINRIWSIRKKKKLWKRFLTYNLILFLGPVSVSLSIATTTVVSKYFPQFHNRANLGALLLSAVLITLTYKIFPNKKVHWRAAAISGLSVALICELAKLVYAAYTHKMMFYNKVYGGLAVLPLFLVWIYVNWTIFLAGALFCYMLQHYRSLLRKGAYDAKAHEAHKGEYTPP
ncbi:MAG: YhjD/YihY/BrkB family envelope integrity protein [Bdellovibrionota bacterium]